MLQLMMPRRRMGERFGHFGNLSVAPLLLEEVDQNYVNMIGNSHFIKALVIILVLDNFLFQEPDDGLNINQPGSFC